MCQDNAAGMLWAHECAAECNTLHRLFMFLDCNTNPVWNQNWMWLSQEDVALTNTIMPLTRRREHMVRSRRGMLITDSIYHHLDLVLPSLQNYEK